MRFLLGLLLAVTAWGCGPYNSKHYHTRGPAAHFPNCRAKCPAVKAGDKHERRRK